MQTIGCLSLLVGKLNNKISLSVYSIYKSIQTYVLIFQCDRCGCFDGSIIVHSVVMGDNCILRYTSSSILLLYLVFSFYFAKIQCHGGQCFGKGVSFLMF
jgi:hypothetical protein